MSKPFGIIYKATNIINGCGYVGQTTMTFERRKKKWKNAAKNGSNLLFCQAIREFGFDNFTFKILCECTSKTDLNHTEENMIIIHHTHYTEGGYNKQKRSQGNQGWHHSEETKKRLSELSKTQQRNKNWHHTEEAKKKMSEVQKGNTNSLGKITSEETKRKISIAKKGIPRSEETKRKIADYMKNNKYWLGKHHNDETKIKISNGLREYHQQKQLLTEGVGNVVME
jgi:group I intron endonuclease